MELWELANAKRSVHRFSTLIPAEFVQREFGKQEAVDACIEWCKATAVTKVYVESFRNYVLADRQLLLNARQSFENAGIEASGCVTPTMVGKPSTRWKELISCYTDIPTQNGLREIFEHAASVADEIMIDDFWFTDCACPECNAAREAKTVRIGEQAFPAPSDTWDDYRCELMVQLSRKHIIEAAKRVNPKCKLIIKYPQWYDRFQQRGYEVIRESADFDRTWAGTETRNYPGKPGGGAVPQYEAYFMMRWMLDVSGEKCGGGWYDPYDTTEETYIEQARQTILAGARESLLFCYPALQKNTGPRNIEALRQHIPELLDVAGEVLKRQPIGIAAYKPAGSPHIKEPFVFDFVGMLGLPLVPVCQFPPDAPALFLSTHALKDPDLAGKLSRYLSQVRPVLVTEALFDRLPPQVDIIQRHLYQLEVMGNPESLLELPQSRLDALREPLLKPLGYTLKAPNKVGFYPFADGSWVLENFNPAPVVVELNGDLHALPGRGWLTRWK